MTLILTRTSDHYVLQVTDRRLMQAYDTFDPQSNRIVRNSSTFDPWSNKNVVYHARDALVTMGYTGNAYIEGRPTDHWIVEQLIGTRLGGWEPEDRPAAIRISTERPTQWLDIGQSLQLLRERLTASLARLHRNVRRTISLHVIIVGWQWNRCHRPWPISARLSRFEGGNTVDLYYRRRYWNLDDPERWKRRFKDRATPVLARRKCEVGAAPPGNFSPSELAAVIDPDQGPDDAERGFVQVMRQVAARTPVVGPDCMSILLPPPGAAPLRIRYIADQTATPAHRTTAGFSPWIVGPHQVRAPSFIIGTFTFDFGPFTVRQEGPGPVGDLLMTIGSQPRPPCP